VFLLDVRQSAQAAARADGPRTPTVRSPRIAMSLATILEGFVGFLEHGAGELLPHWLDRPQRLPRRGTHLCNRERLRLNGQDLRPDGVAEGFAVDLPKRTILRVEELRRLGRESVWVQPLRTDLLAALPASQRQAAFAYGFALEIPPGILKAQFEILSAAT
jgi:hypothetical protein